MTRMSRGQCTLSADDAGRILDRLAGLEQVIRPDDIRQALTATGRVSTRSCVLTSEVILWVVLAMGLLTDLPIRQVFKQARRLRVGEQSLARSSRRTQFLKRKAQFADWSGLEVRLVYDPPSHRKSNPSERLLVGAGEEMERRAPELPEGGPAMHPGDDLEGAPSDREAPPWHVS